MNKHAPHVYVIPEDARNEQIANGFVEHHQVKHMRIKIMPPAGGWPRVLETFRDEYISKLRDYPNAHVVMLIDFDDEVEKRKAKFEDEIPEEFNTRVFVVGSKHDPETLKRARKIGFEEIGKSLADDCDATLESLLGEIIDYAAVASWPQPDFTCRQASSYDRATVAPDKPGWFANSDQNQFIRIETNQDRTEKVMLDADGPGCVVRFRLTTDRNKKGTLRFYLDGAAESALVPPLGPDAGRNRLASGAHLRRERVHPRGRSRSCPLAAEVLNFAGLGRHAARAMRGFRRGKDGSLSVGRCLRRLARRTR